MPHTHNKLPLPGSHRFIAPFTKEIGKTAPEEKIDISVYVRRNTAPPAALQKCIHDLMTLQPGKRKYLSDEEFNEAYGANPDDLKKVADWAEANGLQVKEQNAVQKRIVLSGTAAALDKAFSTELNEYEHPKFGRFRGRTGDLFVPHDVFGIIEGVFGLDTRPLGKSRRKKCKTMGCLPWEEQATTKKSGKAHAAPALKNKWPGTFFPTEAAGLYNYPAGTDGTGQNIAIFAFNGLSSREPHGGYKLSALQTYFEKVLGEKTPVISDVVVHGAGNNPGPDTAASSNAGDSTGEVMLDICVVGATAPGAKIFMYFTEFTSRGWVDALHDAIAGSNGISVISISYGNPENGQNSAWTSMGVKVVNSAFEAAVAKGITICCASGDDGSNDDGVQKDIFVDFPASSPFVLGVGGTKLIASPDGRSVAAETVWNEMFQDEGAGGGGISVVFSKPDYQNGVPVPSSVKPPHKIGRGVPDVAALADPITGVVIMHIDGKNLEPIGGTSAAAPLWAALVLRLNQGLKARCGFLNTLLYTKYSKGILIA